MTKIFFMQTATFHGFIRWEKTGFIVAFAEKVVKISFKTVRRREKQRRIHGKNSGKGWKYCPECDSIIKL